MWEVAGGKRGRRRAPAANIAAHHTTGPIPLAQNEPTPQDPFELAAAVDRAVARVQDRVAALRSSAFATTSIEATRVAWAAARDAAMMMSGEFGLSDAAGRLLCLGIGSVSSSSASACQLALALLLLEALGISDCAWADPVMSPVDKLVGERLGLSSKHHAVDSDMCASNAPFLLYMPHCDRSLYENVLAANVHRPPGEEHTIEQASPIDPSSTLTTSEEQAHLPLSQVVVLGNSFASYVSRDEMRLCPEGTPGAPSTQNLMRRLRDCTSETPLAEYEAFPEAFNDLAVMSFPPALVAGWRRREATAGSVASCTEGGDAASGDVGALRRSRRRHGGAPEVGSTKL